MTLEEWAIKWSIPSAALAELSSLPIPGDMLAHGAAGISEAAVSQRVRLAAAHKGIRLWRNNVGAVTTEDGRHIRFGLANDSAKMNKVLKSSDLIGITPHVVKTSDIGRTLGIFTSLEVKHEGWRYTGTEREEAQRTWLQAITNLGGVASFATEPGIIEQLT